MSTHIGIGFSQNTNTYHAAREAVSLAKNEANRKHIHLAIVFSTIHHNPLEITHALTENLNQTRIVGCSTAGVILPGFVERHGVAVLVIASDEIHFSTAAQENVSQHDLYQVGSALAKAAGEEVSHQRRQAFLLFFDGLLPTNAPLIKGVQETFGNIFPIVGAGSCDDFHFTQNYQIFGDKTMSNAVCGLLIAGQMNIGIGCSHGWSPLGKPRAVSEAQGHIIRTIDGERASHLYETYLGEETQKIHTMPRGRMSIVYPLGIYLEDEKEYLLRNAVDILEDGSIVCQGDIPEDVEIHMMISSKEACRQAAVSAAREVKIQLAGKKAKLILIFQSLSRHLFLGRDSQKEVAAIREILGEDTPVFGMLSCGEISPYLLEEEQRRIHYQNESVLILAIG